MERAAGQVCTGMQASSSHSGRLGAKVLLGPSPRKGLLVARAPNKVTGQVRRSGWLRALKPEESFVGLAEKQDRTSKEQQKQQYPMGNSDDEDDIGFPMFEAENSSPMVATLTFLGGLGLLAAGGYFFKDQVSGFVEFFVNAKDEWGPAGYLAYAVVYTGLEVLAVPAIPLTMTAGVIFGTIPGTIVVSISGTIAAGLAFLIARYAAREKVRTFAAKYPQFQKIDKAIAKDGLKFVTLLRLSPLLPLAVSNYFYGLTSVDLGSYMLGSWLGMLPGTFAYVSAGEAGKAVLMEGEGSMGVETWQVALALGVTLGVIGYVGNLAKKAIEEESGPHNN